MVYHYGEQILPFVQKTVIVMHKQMQIYSTYWVTALWSIRNRFIVIVHVFWEQLSFTHKVMVMVFFMIFKDLNARSRIYLLCYCSWGFCVHCVLFWCHVLYTALRQLLRVWESSHECYTESNALEISKKNTRRSVVSS